MTCSASDRRPRRQLTRRFGRRGATALEMALVLPIFLVLVLGMLDLGIAVMRHNVLSEAARTAAREAIVHGALANRLGTWGPSPFSGSAADGHPIVQKIQPLLQNFDPSEVTVSAEWPQGGNELDQPVLVTVSTPYRPALTYVLGNITFTLTGTSTMPIAH